MTTQISGDTGVSQCQPNSVSQDDLQSGVVGRGPAFSAYASVSTSLTTVAYTKVIFQVEEFDTNGNYDPVTAVFKPTVAGYYMVNAMVVINSFAGQLIGAIYKNGVQVKNGPYDGSGSTQAITASVSALIYMNGTTDEIDFRVYNAQATQGLNVSVPQNNYFSAVLVRAA